MRSSGPPQQRNSAERNGIDECIREGRKDEKLRPRGEHNGH
jgi:hypothetical protein